MAVLLAGLYNFLFSWGSYIRIFGIDVVLSHSSCRSALHGVWDVLKADSPATGSEAVGIPLPHPFGPVGLVCHKALELFLVAYII